MRQRKPTDEEFGVMLIVCALLSLGLLLFIALCIAVMDGDWMSDSFGEYFGLWAITGVMLWIFR